MVGAAQEWRHAIYRGADQYRASHLSGRRGSRARHIYEASEIRYMKDHRLSRGVYMGWVMILMGQDGQGVGTLRGSLSIDLAWCLCDSCCPSCPKYICPKYSRPSCPIFVSILSRYIGECRRAIGVQFIYRYWDKFKIIGTRLDKVWDKIFGV